MSHIKNPPLLYTGGFLLFIKFLYITQRYNCDAIHILVIKSQSSPTNVLWAMAFVSPIIPATLRCQNMFGDGMKKLVLASVIAGLAACGGSGGSSSSNDAVPGVQVTGISGLNYKIGDRTGIVKSGESIPYDAGDEISFSLGKITLATIPAKDNINLSDLFPDLPTTAKDIRFQLRLADDVTEPLQSSEDTEQKEYSYGATPTLHRTSNIMRLLLAMDNDGNAENGLDLVTGDWAGKLANFDEDTLPLNSNLKIFERHGRVEAFSQIHSLPLNMDIADPLSALYAAAGIEVKVKPVTGFNTQGVTPSTTGQFVLTANMQLASTTETSSSIITNTYDYDERGNIVKHLYQLDTGSDGAIDRSQETLRTYSIYGANESYNAKYRDGNGDLTSHRRISYANLDNKRLLSEAKRTNSLDDTANYNVYVYTYNDAGLLTKITYEEYDASDALISSRERGRYQYTDNKVSVLQDSVYYGSSLSYAANQTYTYSDNSITVDSIRKNSSDEIIINSSFSYTETFADDRLIKGQKIKFTGDIDSEVLEKSTVDFEYDELGRVTSCTWYVNDDQNTRERNRFTYGPHGMTEKTSIERYNSETDTFGGGGSVSYTYGEEGETLSETEDNKHFTYASENAANGIAYLVHELRIMDDELRRRNDECHSL